MPNVVISNFSNGTVFIAIGNEIGGQFHDSHGWETLPQNQSKTFSGQDGTFYLRIVDSNGNEVPLSPSPSGLLQFPFFNDLTRFFEVFREFQDPAIITFTLQGQGVPVFTHNQHQSDPLPDGWSLGDFFNAGSGNTTFNVQPS